MSEPLFPIVYSELTAADLDAVVTVERQSFERSWTRSHFQRELETDVSRTIVARRGDMPEAVLGYICRWIVADEMQIQNLAVHEGHRRRGIGRRLMNLVLEEGRRAGVAAVTLDVRAGNLPAIALYEGFGFAEVGRRRNYYGRGQDGILMTLEVTGITAERP